MRPFFFCPSTKWLNQMRYSNSKRCWMVLSPCLIKPGRGTGRPCATGQAAARKSLSLFQLYFDDEGRADSEWNVPLQRLAKFPVRARYGAGPIKLAMQSMPFLASERFVGPQSESGANDFQSICKALKENRLGLPVVASAPKRSAPRKRAWTGRWGDSDASKMKPSWRIPIPGKTNLRPKTVWFCRASQKVGVRSVISGYVWKALTTQHDAEISELLQHRLEIQAYRTQQRELEQSVEHLKVMNDQGKRQARSPQRAVSAVAEWSQSL